MRIEMVVIGICALFVAYGLGYIIGFRHCFDFIKDELDRFQEKKDVGDT